MPHWILQNNIYSEEGWEALTSALDRLGLSYSVHKCVPFSGELDPPFDPTRNGFLWGSVIPMGSYTLVKKVAALQTGCKGVWLNGLNYQTQIKQWGLHMLNSDAVLRKFSALTMGWVKDEPMFVRPLEDTKAFTGAVFHRDQIEDWQNRVSVLGVENGGQLQMDTWCLRAKPKELYNETRCWIVDKKVVTASGYKLGSLKRYSPPETVDRRTTDFAEMLASWWSPDRAYVMDVADTPLGLRVIEVNNINSAGFYKADMVRLAMALDRCADLA